MELLIFFVGFLLGLIFCYFFMNKKIKQTELFSNQLKEQNIQLRAEQEQINRNKEILEKTLQQTIEANILRAMQTNNNNFISLANQTLEKYIVDANKTLENKTLQVAKIIEPLQKTLENYEQKINQFSNQTISGLSSINTIVKHLTQTNNLLAQQANNLSNALKTTKVRGRWAEISLRNIVEYIGLQKHIDFIEQSTTDQDQSRPDMIIRLPNNRNIIVDSKIPLDALLDAFEAKDQQKQQLLFQKHIKAIKDAIRNLSSKNYSSKIDGAIEFSVLYIAIESALSISLEFEPNLITEAMDKKVVLATPTTLLTILNTVNFSWRQYEISENAQQILHETKELYNRMGVFVEHFSKLQNSIQQINTIYNKMVGSWRNRVEPSLKRIENLGIKTNKELPNIDTIQTDEETSDF